VCTLRLNFANALRVVEDLCMWYCFSISWLTKWQLGKKGYKFEVEAACCTLLDCSDKYLWEFWGCVYGSKFVGLYLFILVCPCLIPLEIKIIKSNFKHIFVVLGPFFAFWGKVLPLFSGFLFMGKFLDSHESYCIGFQDVTVRWGWLGFLKDRLYRRGQCGIFGKKDIL
jgi:hypothetical protein